ncbi:AAA family ATPase [candidate division KSB1 bacterium]|nr:AAA family ATPase [candidate division KSB1 bacterium]
MKAPLVIIITGPPCVGKTTLGRKIAEKFQLPFVHKDGIKELLFDLLGWKDREWSKEMSRLSYHLIFYFLEIQLQAKKTVIIESNFSDQEHTIQFLKFKEQYDFITLQINCYANGEKLFQRFNERAIAGIRHPGHVDSILIEELRPRLLKGTLPILKIPCKSIQVDTTDFDKIDYTGIFREIEDHLSR